MHYSGILVRSIPDRLDECIEQVNACEGIDVYLTHEDVSSLVAVIESETFAAQEDQLRAVQELSTVAAADLVYHRSDDDDDLEAWS